MAVKYEREKLRQKEEDVAAAKAFGIILLGVAGVSLLLYLTRGFVTRRPILAPEEQ